MSNNKFALVIPIKNPDEELWKQVFAAINSQTLQPELKLLADSGSHDSVKTKAREHGFTLVPISDFNHGSTRQKCLEQLQHYDYIMFMTQDALLKNNDAFENLLAQFFNPDIAACYGRQLPRPDASAWERHCRTSNYPPQSCVKTADDIPRLGLHTAFCSNTFATYRTSDLLAAGGFPATEFGEDMLAAAQLILTGKSIAYCAEAEVYHSHPSTLRGEFRRGLAIGRMHRSHPWLLDKFGRAESTGFTFLRLFSAKTLLPFGIYGGIKYLGYLTGKYSGKQTAKK